MAESGLEMGVTIKRRAVCVVAVILVIRLAQPLIQFWGLASAVLSTSKRFSSTCIAEDWGFRVQPSIWHSSILVSSLPRDTVWPRSAAEALLFRYPLYSA